MSDADSADEDHTVDVAAQLSTLLKPINKKMKAMARRMEEAEAQLKRVAAAQAEELPALRSTVESEASSLATRIQALQSEVSQCAGKSAVELARQEAQQSEARLRSALDEVRGRHAAQEMLQQGFESRVDATERAQRTAEARFAAEMSATTGGLQTATASLERLRGEVEARLSEVQARSHTGLEGLTARMTAEIEGLEKQLAGIAPQVQRERLPAPAAQHRHRSLTHACLQARLDELRASSDATAAELSKVPRSPAAAHARERLHTQVALPPRQAHAALQQQWRQQQEAISGLQARQSEAVTRETIATLEQVRGVTTNTSPINMPRLTIVSPAASRRGGRRSARHGGAAGRCARAGPPRLRGQAAAAPGSPRAASGRGAPRLATACVTWRRPTRRADER